MCVCEKTGKITFQGRKRFIGQRKEIEKTMEMNKHFDIAFCITSQEAERFLQVLGS